MMIEPALMALFRALSQRLSTNGETWSGRVVSNRPKPGTKRPYVVYQWQGGGERNQMQRRDAEIVVTVRVVSEAQMEALQLAGRLSYLLNDMGDQDKRRDDQLPLDGGPYWQIHTTTQETDIHLAEVVDSKDVYHSGFLLRVVMEEREQV